MLSAVSRPTYYGSTMQINTATTTTPTTMTDTRVKPTKSGRVYASVAEMKRKGKVRMG